MPHNEDGTPSTEGIQVEQNVTQTTATTATSYIPTYNRRSSYTGYNGSGYDYRRHDRENEFDWSLVRSSDNPITEKWFVNNWRPMMAWLYMIMVAFDFIIAPVMSMILPVLPGIRQMPYTAWHPLTLEGGGLIHVTFGAVLGITAWGRTQEKIDPRANEKSG